MGAVITVLPIILQALGVVYHDVVGGNSSGKVDHIIEIASKALAGVPEAIDAFVKLKDSLGGKAPTYDDLIGLKAEIRAQGDKINELAKEAQA